MYHQGTTLSVKKLNIKTIGELKIILPDIEKQRTIGNYVIELNYIITISLFTAFVNM